MKKVIIIILILITLGIIYFVGFSKTRDYGSIYSIAEVYEDGSISYDDLKTLAYYQNDSSNKYNEGLINNDFILNEGDRPNLWERYTLNATLANKINEYYNYQTTYYGIYNDYVVFSAYCKGISSPAVIIEKKLLI